MDDKKWVVASLSDLMSFLMNLPPEVRTLQFVCFIFITADTVTGVVRHAAVGKLSSRRMRMQLLNKLSCYFGLVIVGYVASILSQSYKPILLSYGAVLAVEFTSILENVTSFAKDSGVNMGPVSVFLEKLGGLFEVNQEKRIQTALVTESKTTIPHDTDQPITEISTTTTVEKEIPVVVVKG